MDDFYSLSKPNFHTKAAITAPTMGATKKSQSWERALPPEIRAGPRLRAGLTEVPVTGIVTRWISIRVTPMANPAMALFPNLEVVPKITKMKRKVMTVSITKALTML